MPTDEMRRGDLVEVRSPAEILATLDERGMLDGLPFMPEMLQYCGQRFTVTRRAEKICETMYVPRSREMPRTVLLSDLRCDGSGHGGCQAECRIFWKEAWLKPVGSDAVTKQSHADGLSATTLRELSGRNACIDGGAGEDQYVCQATEHFRASKPLQTWDPRPYLRELVTGNVGLLDWLKVVARAVVQEPRRRFGVRGAFPVHGPRTSDDLLCRHDFKPGELVRTKEVSEISATLTREGENNGVWFDDENIPYCGRTFRVRRRVNRLIDEHTGKMLDMAKEWISLEGVACSGDHSIGRWFCPRAFYVQWTDDWLVPIGDVSDEPAGAH